MDTHDLSGGLSTRYSILGPTGTLIWVIRACQIGTYLAKNGLPKISTENPYFLSLGK